MKLSSMVLGVLTFLFGGIDALLTTFFLVIGIDYVTGILKAIIQKNLNSKVGLFGIVKKCGYILLVVLSVQADRLLGDYSMAIRTVVLYSFIANESLSILENWGMMGLPLPKLLVETFTSLKEKNE